MNSQDIHILKFIQEYKPVSIGNICHKFDISSSSLSKAIRRINDYLPLDKTIHSEGQIIVTEAGYHDYVNFLLNLQLNKYTANPQERIKYLVANLFFTPVVNKHALYQKINSSQSSMKNDHQQLLEYLHHWQLGIEVVHKIGTRIIGNETFFRVAISQILFKTIEIGDNNHLVSRKANNPIDREIVNIFLSCCSSHIAVANAIFDQRLSRHRLDYNSKKLIIILISLFLYRMGLGFECKPDDIALPIEHARFELLTTPTEDYLFDALVPALINGDESVSGSWRQDAITLISMLGGQPFSHHDPLLVNEVCHSLHAILLHMKLKIRLDDKKVADIKREHGDIYEKLAKCIGFFEEKYGVEVCDYSIASLCVIFKKYELRHMLTHREKNRVIILTNSSDILMRFFKEKLTSYFNVDVVDMLNINELGRLDTLSFDKVITFTNKISSSLRQYNAECIKVSFKLSVDDIKILLDAGLSLAGSRGHL